MKASELDIIDIRKRFGKMVVLDGISLKVSPGQRHGLIGVNGAGKTTLFNVIAGDLKADGGDVLLDGQSIMSLSMQGRALAGLCRTYQISSLAPTLTVRANLVLAMSDGKLPSLWQPWLPAGHEPGLVNLAERFGLAEYLDVTVSDISHGAQRQLELAMVLHKSPKVLMLDEPAAGLSPAERAALLNIIRELPRSISLLIIEHDMDIILQVSDWITVLHEGEILTAGHPSEVAKDARVREVYLGYADA